MDAISFGLLVGAVILFGSGFLLLGLELRQRWIEARGKPRREEPEATPTTEIRRPALRLVAPISTGWQPSPQQEAYAAQAAEGVAARERLRELAEREREAAAARRVAVNEAAVRAAAVGVIGERDERTAERKTWAMPAPAESQVRARTRDTLPDDVEVGSSETRRGVA